MGPDGDGVAEAGAVVGVLVAVAVMVVGGVVVVDVQVGLVLAGRAGNGAAAEAGLDEGLQGGEAGAGDAG